VHGMGSAKTGDNPPPQTRASMAEHIAVEAGRLARMAKLNEFSLLAYLIDMAVLEAWREAGESGDEPAVSDPQPSPGR
jgi:hypothetical protein